MRSIAFIFVRGDLIDVILLIIFFSIALVFLSAAFRLRLTVKTEKRKQGILSTISSKWKTGLYRTKGIKVYPSGSKNWETITSAA
jgi:hypothetical protein